MICHKCEHLEDYLDDLLSPAPRSEFEAHLESCPACRNAVSFETAASNALRQFSSQLPPPPKPLRRPLQDTARQRTRIVIGLVVAASVTFLLVPFVSFRRFNSRHQTSGSHVPAPAGHHQQIVSAAGPKRGGKIEIEELESSSHVAVVEADDDDPFAFVMLYPKYSVEDESDDP